MKRPIPCFTESCTLWKCPLKIERCLKDLKEIGFQVGCGFMVGSPMQTTAALAKDLKFIEEFSPDMCGIGPFIPHKDTPFAKFPGRKC